VWPGVERVTGNCRPMPDGELSSEGGGGRGGGGEARGGGGGGGGEALERTYVNIRRGGETKRGGRTMR